MSESNVEPVCNVCGYDFRETDTIMQNPGLTAYEGATMSGSPVQFVEGHIACPECDEMHYVRFSIEAFTNNT